MKRIKWIFFLLSVLIRTLLATEVWADTLTLNEVDSTMDVGESSSGTALDSNSHQGICYHDQTHHALQYAYFDGLDWQYDTVDGNDGQNKNLGLECALAFDDQDQPHIVYYNTTDHEIRHAYHDGLAWHIVVVANNVDYDILAFSAHRLSLKVHPLGGLGMAYYDIRQRDLIYGEWDGQDWALVTVENQGDSGRHPSLAYDSQGRAAISYMRYINADKAELRYVEFDGEDWVQSVTLDETAVAGRYSSLVFDGHGVPHIAYHHSRNNSQSLRYINRVGGQWNASTELVTPGVAFASIGEFVQMTFNPAGHLHLIYRYYFFSALFGRAFYLKMGTIYFADLKTSNRAWMNEQNIVASAAPTRDYNGMSVAMDANNHLVYSAVIENVFAQTDALHAGEITHWAPYAEYVTAENQVAVNDQVEIQWRDDDPDSNARIRFAFRQGMDEFPVAGVVEEDGENRVILDTAFLEPGEYNLTLEISDDNFVMTRSSWSGFVITVPERVQPAPQPQPQPQAQPQQQPENQQQDDVDQQQEEEQQQQQQEQEQEQEQPQEEPVQEQQPDDDVLPAVPQQQNQNQAAEEEEEEEEEPAQAQDGPAQQAQAGEEQGDVEQQQEQKNDAAEMAVEIENENGDDENGAAPADVAVDEQAAENPQGQNADSEENSGDNGGAALSNLLSKTAASCSLVKTPGSGGADASVAFMMLGVAGLVMLRKHVGGCQEG